jgi:hypothetical protein
MFRIAWTVGAPYAAPRCGSDVAAKKPRVHRRTSDRLQKRGARRAIRVIRVIEVDIGEPTELHRAEA